MAAGGDTWKNHGPTRERFTFARNIIYNTYANAGNGSVGPNWGVPSKVNKTPTISYEGVIMVGQGGAFSSTTRLDISSTLHTSYRSLV